MKFITVFTPAYNRAYCLDRLYHSLLRQTNQNFRWLVVDDGSTDNTRELVSSWIADGKLDVEYIHKPNGGMHTAHNTAYANISTDLNVCIDSDDFMPDNVISSIYKEWKPFKNDNSIAGLIGLDESISGELIGVNFNKEYEPTTLLDYYHKQGGSGDKKLVLRSKLTMAYPAYPEYPEERLVPLDTLYTLICRDYKLIPVNKVWITVDYQVDGSSATIINQYFKSPKGFRYAREISMIYNNVFKLNLRSAIHYNISTFIIGDKYKILSSPKPVLTVLLSPLSFIFYLYLKRKNS